MRQRLQQVGDERWLNACKSLQKPVVFVDWGALFSYRAPLEDRGATIKPEGEASDETAKCVTDAFERPYINGLFLCKLLGNHRNDANFFQDRATRTYLRNDGPAYEYRTNALKQANIEVQKSVLQAIIS